MSHYGQGGVSADFVGMARRARQKALPDVVQIYVSGCSGNVTAGKYNDGSPGQPPGARVADRDGAWQAAWAATKRFPLEEAAFRLVPLRFEPRERRRVQQGGIEAHGWPTITKPFGQCLAALGLSWRERRRVGPDGGPAGPRPRSRRGRAPARRDLRRVSAHGPEAPTRRVRDGHRLRRVGAPATFPRPCKWASKTATFATGAGSHRRGTDAQAGAIEAGPEASALTPLPAEGPDRRRQP